MGQIFCPPSQSARSIHSASEEATASSNKMSSGGDVGGGGGVATSSQKVLMDYQQGEYKGFVFVIHQKYGLMLLYCTRKKKKPPHWQLCGGKIDDSEFIKAAKHGGSPTEQLLYAARDGTARELFEETGIDFRKNIDRLQPVRLHGNSSSICSSSDIMNEYKHRLFFYCLVNDDDFSTTQGVTPIHATNVGCQHLKIKISHEHSGFTFQPDPKEAAKMINLHSGGKPSDVLLMMAERKKQDGDDDNNNNAVQQGSDSTRSHAYGFLM